MKAFLIRVGSDHSFGGWNAPVDSVSGEFIYVPIPEKAKKFHPNCCRQFAEVKPAIQEFCSRHQIKLRNKLKPNKPMHLDPDFETLTYGDDGSKRGKEIKKLKKDDLLVFYASLRPIRECDNKLLYAIVGLYVIKEIVYISKIPRARWPENAHTRKLKHGPHDIVVRAKRGASGRLERCILIGEWRDRAYRVTKKLLADWGGLSVKNGYIQRSAVSPSFQQPGKFVKWLRKQQITLSKRNF